MTTTVEKMNAADIRAKSKEELVELATAFGIEDETIQNLSRREDLLSKVLQTVSAQQFLIASGILEVMDGGYGFLRQVNSIGGSGDVYISQSQIRRFGLKTGDTVTGQVRPPKEGERYFGLPLIFRLRQRELPKLFLLQPLGFKTKNSSVVPLLP